MAKTKRLPPVPLERFHKHFSSSNQWGARWEECLYPALLQPTHYTTLRNRYATGEAFDQAMQTVEQLEPIRLPFDNGLNCYISKKSAEDQNKGSNNRFPEPGMADNGLYTHWNLDLASLLIVNVLGAQPGDKVLDLCAAPGGKSIALAQSVLQPSALSSTACVHSNEFNTDRMKRLDDNLKHYVPAAARHSKASLCIHLDGTSPTVVFPLGVGGYDKVLVDAPCSSERHIIHAQGRAARSGPQRISDELSRWSPLLAKRLAETQVKLLQNAFRSVRVGGRVLYATCSISREENDDVVESTIRLTSLQCQKNAISWICQPEILSSDAQAKLETWAERTKSGWIVLPDHATPYGTGSGPLYFSVLTKIKAPRTEGQR